LQKELTPDIQGQSDIRLEIKYMNVIFELFLKPLLEERTNLKKISEMSGPVPGSIILDYSAARKVKGLFNKVTIRKFSNSVINVELVADDNFQKRVPTKLLQALFFELGPDSNDVDQLDVPSISPFGDECYGWYLDQNNLVVQTDQAPYCGLGIIWEGNMNTVTIADAQNLGFEW
jgi:hypothetical protein